MAIMQALRQFGVTGVLLGNEPSSEAEYRERVRLVDAQKLPPWDAVERAVAEAQVATRRELVRAEARQRVAAAMDYDSWDDAAGIIGENARRMIVLMIGVKDATEAEARELADLQALSAVVDRIWAAYLAIPDDPPPADFLDPKWWPK